MPSRSVELDSTYMTILNGNRQSTLKYSSLEETFHPNKTRTGMSDETMEQTCHGIRPKETKDSAGNRIWSHETKDSTGNGIGSHETKDSTGNKIGSHDTKDSTGKGIGSHETKDSTGKGIGSHETKDRTGNGMGSHETKDSTGNEIRSQETRDSTEKGIGSDEEETLTDFQGFMLLLPCYIGIGFLELPYMVKLLGLWSGSIGQLLYGSLNILASLMLVDCTNTLTKRTGEWLHDFGRVAEISMAHGPSCLQSHAGKFRLSVNTSILINYGLFLPDLLSTMNLFMKDFLLQYVIINDVVSIVGISVLLLPVYLTRRIKLLSYLTTAGNIVLFGISIIAFQYICRDLPDTSTRPAFKPVNFVTFTSFVNDVMFSFDGISLILPVRARMANKKRFDGLNGVLGVALVFVTSFHIGCGFFGYLKFGELTQVNFILNLPGDQWVYQSLKLLSFVTMYLSIGMVVYIVTGLVWGRLSTMVRDDGVVRNNGESVCRVLLLIFTGTFTILVPELEHLISLTGCFGPLYVVLVVPFVVKLLTLYGEEEPALPLNKFKRKLTFLACVIILIFGIYSTISGIGVAVYTTLYHIEV